ncbi:DNA polymerase III subunit beta [Candidatus Odyssella acanthamoebae]|uniref:Beta sliding clamp n=1 Tax=Candidatus Odyssella acanthamoebae TaxID=91604 RepID=A0A077AV41_9PROT|nr:DNA polymerase III subunit beta [Candidatus Paracaedibacter acanthamoebae]AIK95488.1 DNA polymerase III subunit beta [Candidatus Paracaedibacter acanthamoebae]
MKFAVERGEFLKALTHGGSVVEKRTTVPILSHVLIHAEDGQLNLTTTDMDLALVETIPAVVEKPGAITVSAHMVLEIVRKLPEGVQIEATLNPENDQIALKAGKSRFNISTLPAEQFPKLTQNDLPFSFKLTAEKLRYLIDRSRFAMSTEETRYFLNGIYFHAHEVNGQKVLRSVATDAHRLACIEVDIPDGAEAIPGIIIGRKTITEIRKLINDENAETEITISLSPQRVEFKLPQAILSSRLVDGTYPDYEQAIPVGNDKPIIVDAKDFAKAVDRVATVTTDKLPVIKISVAKNKLTLVAASSELGDATEEMEVDFPFDQSIEIGFNANYLVDITSQIGDEAAEILLSDGSAPAIIKGINDKEALFVLMPMRV